MNLESLANTDIDSWTEDQFDPDESRSKHIYNEQDYELETENVATTTKSTAAEEYKVRYNVLRQMYEQRLRGLVTQMHFRVCRYVPRRSRASIGQQRFDHSVSTLEKTRSYTRSH